MSLRFEGPYSWTGDTSPSVFTCPESGSVGLYIWAVPTTAGELVQYGWQTGRSFRIRFAEHLRDHTSGAYQVHDVAELCKGRKLTLWPGIYGPGMSRTTVPFVARLGEICPPATGIRRVGALLPCKVGGTGTNSMQDRSCAGSKHPVPALTSWYVP
jgi:hypothetical protein